MRRARQKSSLHSFPVPLINDGAIAGEAVGGGRLIPVLIIDTSNRPDIDELVRMHAHLPPGDVTNAWGAISGKKIERQVTLVLHFAQPLEVEVAISFEMPHHAGIVDQILIAQCLYLQPGRSGERLRGTIDHPRILIEVMNPDFRAEWDELLPKVVVSSHRQRGLTRQQARVAAQVQIAEWRRAVRFRMPGRN